MTKEEKNHQAYSDCCDLLPPTMPHDEEYMECYRGWRNLARFPEDVDCYLDYSDDDRVM